MTSPAGRADRNPALDFTKGALVLFMVLYHWLNYFVSAQGFYYRYLRFLTPSFIFITGFIVSHIYLAKYGAASRMLPGRLLLRGVKLLGIFLLLNAVRAMVMPGSGISNVLSVEWLTSNLAPFLATENQMAGSGRSAAFLILIPISYLLLSSAGLVLFGRLHNYAIHVVGGLFLAGVFLLNLLGAKNAFLELVSVGLLGVLLGYVSADVIANMTRHPYLFLTAYLGYLIAITSWDIIYPLQVVGVFLTVVLIYTLGARDHEPGWFVQQVILLGKYSLFGYITQIAILQLLRRGLGTWGLETAGLVTSFFAAFALTLLSVIVADYARAKFAVVDSMYKAVFS